jgi:hypothetical protein
MPATCRVALLGEIEVLRLYATYGMMWVTSIHEDNACLDFVSFDARGELVPKGIPWQQCDIGLEGTPRLHLLQEKSPRCSRSLSGLGQVDDMDGSIHDMAQVHGFKRPTQT